MRNTERGIVYALLAMIIAGARTLKPDDARIPVLGFPARAGLTKPNVFRLHCPHCGESIKLEATKEEVEK